MHIGKPCPRFTAAKWLYQHVIVSSRRTIALLACWRIKLALLCDTFAACARWKGLTQLDCSTIGPIALIDKLNGFTSMLLSFDASELQVVHNGKTCPSTTLVILDHNALNDKHNVFTSMSLYHHREISLCCHVKESRIYHCETHLITLHWLINAMV